MNAPCRGGALLRPRAAILSEQRAEQSPAPYNLPRKKVTPIKSSVAPSIDGSRSKATSYKLDAPTYQAARTKTPVEVTTEWNAA